MKHMYAHPTIICLYLFVLGSQHGSVGLVLCGLKAPRHGPPFLPLLQCVFGLPVSCTWSCNCNHTVLLEGSKQESFLQGMLFVLLFGRNCFCNLNTRPLHLHHFKWPTILYIVITLVHHITSFTVLTHVLS